MHCVFEEYVGFLCEECVVFLGMRCFFEECISFFEECTVFLRNALFFEECIVFFEEWAVGFFEELGFF